METRKLNKIGLAVIVTALLSLAGGLAIAAQMKPELAAKKENHRKQEEQRITPEKRKVAIDALKAERIKIYKAKQANKPVKSLELDNK